MWKLQPIVEQQQKKEEEKKPEEGEGVVRKSSMELQKQRLDAKKKTDITKAATGKTRKDPTEIRIGTEIADLDPTATPGVECTWPNKKDLLNFEVKVRPQEGLYKGAQFKFLVKVPKGYPHNAPTCTCETRVYHPNIDFNGRVCLNILRADWNPCLGVSHVVMGLMTLFLEPNPDDPLNTEAADLMCKSPQQFKDTVAKSLRGEYVAGHQFQKLI